MRIGPYQDDAVAGNLFPSSILPIIVILCFMLYPEASQLSIIIGSIGIAIVLGIAFYAKIKKWQYYVGIRSGIIAIYIDLSGLFIALLIFRAYQSLLSAIFSVALVAFVIILAHKYYETILSELHSPKSRLGKIILFFGLAGGAIGAGVGYWSVNLFGVHLVLPFLLILFLILIAIFHANFHQAAFSEGH